MQILPAALAPLGYYNQFIIVKLIPRNDGTGKTDKLPINHHTCQIMQRGIDWKNEPATWTDAITAINIAMMLGSD